MLWHMERQMRQKSGKIFTWHRYFGIDKIDRIDVFIIIIIIIILLYSVQHWRSDSNIFKSMSLKTSMI